MYGEFADLLRVFFGLHGYEWHDLRVLERVVVVFGITDRFIAAGEYQL
ncbi:MAG: hypothetical protein WB565_14455 [Acidimicrobiales bacterium]